MKNYRKTIDKLNSAMVRDYRCVNLKTNWISIDLPKLTKNQLIYIVQQYSWFPRNIVGFLGNSKAVANRYNVSWLEVVNELSRNICEELGSDTKGISHYNLLKDGLREELSIDIECEPRSATYAFLSYLYSQKENSEVIAGATYACESSAVPELVVVKRVLDRLSVLSNGRELSRDGILQKFFDKHLGKWEPGHEQGLLKAYEIYIKKQHQLEDFEHGFRSMLTEMDLWWYGMYSESFAF
ncbi:MAG: DUF3865 domain-containing protein [Candidatus Aenigmarchaeota archaeon]|nr:DUF3865 domain-containing protein [Candidatus Aenigmarchaeota archaeon]